MISYAVPFQVLIEAESADIALEIAKDVQTEVNSRAVEAPLPLSLAADHAGEIEVIT